MALGENQNKIQYTVTTSDDSFDFPYKYWASSEMVVTKLASGVETSPSFTLSPTNGDTKNGATVTLDVAVESCTVTIERIVALESEANYQRGALSPTGLTEQFDKGVALSQQINEKLDRAPVAPTTDPDGLNYAVGTVSERAGKADGWDENGNKVALSIATEGGAYASVDTTKGLGATAGGTLFAKVDDVTTEFDAGNIVVKAVDTAQLVDESVTLAKVDGSALSGSDATMVTGTKGTADNLVSWNTDGDAVDSGESVASVLADASTYTDAHGIVQSYYEENATAYPSITTIIPDDTSVPLVTAGTEIFSKLFTPTSATNKVRVEVNLHMLHTASGGIRVLSVFAGTTCIGAYSDSMSTGGDNRTHFICEHTSGTTSETDYSVRVGPASGTVTVNAGQTLGGMQSSKLVITEFGS